METVRVDYEALRSVLAYVCEGTGEMPMDVFESIHALAGPSQFRVVATPDPDDDGTWADGPFVLVAFEDCDARSYWFGELIPPNPKYTHRKPSSV